MNKNWLLIMVAIVVFVAAGCQDDSVVLEPAESAPDEAPAAPAPAAPAPAGDVEIADGRYRGIYGDGGEQQISIQFDVEGGLIQNVSYRHLAYRGTDFRALDEDAPLYPVFQQHQQAGEWLEGRPVAAIAELRSPGNIIGDVDGWSGASIRGAKIHSAMRDGLNRGVYSPANGFDQVSAHFQDGRYRGIYEDGGEQQVSVQFDIEEGTIKNVSFRHLAYRGTDFRSLDEDNSFYPILQQHRAAGEWLEGRPLESIAQLHSTGDIIDDLDGWSGATIRGAKIYSAMRDALNRGIYSPANGFDREIGSYADGRYRGIYGDGGEQQVSVQFNVTDDTIGNVSFRHLAYRGTNFRSLEEDNPLYAVVTQHQQITEHLEGKPLSAIYDLHDPGDFIDDVDGWSGATIRANKVFSAIRDGLNRGLY